MINLEKMKGANNFRQVDLAPFLIKT